MRDSAVDSVILAGFTAVADSGPIPLAAATAIPLAAFFVRRRYTSKVAPAGN